MTRDEILAAIRASGLSDRNGAHAVILETDASFSVVKRSDSTAESSLANVRRGTERSTP